VLTTVLFTDIVGSMELAAKLGDLEWRDLLERHHCAIRRELDRFRGREIDTAGDSFLAGVRRAGKRDPLPGASSLPFRGYDSDGKEGIDGSSPSEGFSKVPANKHLIVACPLNTRTHFGHMCGARDAPRRLAAPSDTSSHSEDAESARRTACY
jgi:class 3 adenylate cyclase